MPIDKTIGEELETFLTTLQFAISDATTCKQTKKVLLSHLLRQEELIQLITSIVTSAETERKRYAYELKQLQYKIDRISQADLFKKS